MSSYDLVIAGGTVVVPYQEPAVCDVGVKDGRVAALGHDLQPAADGELVDASGLFVLPGAIDAHAHWGIYRPFEADVRSESESAVAGGVTTVISYFRTGQHYLEKTGSYRDIFPEVVGLTSGNAYCDFSYHIAPMNPEHVDEIPYLVDEWGVSSFKNYMFYKGLNLAGDSADAASFTMGADPDLGHLLRIMEKVAEENRRRRTQMSVSLHCEHSELIKLFLQRAQKKGWEGLEGYSRSRPPLTEELALAEAVVLGAETGCPLNLLHLSSAPVFRSAVEARGAVSGLTARTEVTLHHLALSWEELQGITAKVNPPLRTQDDIEVLWDGIRRGDVDWVVSDHACCPVENKQGELWHILPGFGGTPLLYPTLLTLGWQQRKLPLTRMVELVSANPARAFGLYPRKGTIALGSDADFSLVDPGRVEEVTVERLHSAQEFTPFAGRQMVGWPERTILRGKTVFTGDSVVGGPAGTYLKRTNVQDG